MPKIKPKIYARALVEVKKFNAKNFFRLLEKNGDTKKLKEITALAEKMMLVKMGSKKIILQTARRLEGLTLQFSNKDVVEEEINPALIAGVKIIIDGERQLDFSLQKRLNEIFT